MSDVHHSPTTLPYPFMQSKPTFCRQRVPSDPYAVLNSSSSLDHNRRQLLEYILDTDWYRNDTLEPKLGTPEAHNILFCMNVFHNVTFPPTRIRAGRSLYTLLTDPATYKCLMCGSTKKSAQRAVECARSHIGHRPFRCRGWRSGCNICRPSQEPMRFFSSRLLKEHEESTERRVVCGACNAELCRKGFRRHWSTMHSNLPLPKDRNAFIKVRNVEALV
ncbi:hypothetical protein CPB86DRAFT_769635 [Serendipita vermifera]|nr:hypothetical protein CPB86DRAFT_769635 [Serendipita vermifera]